MCNLRLSVFLQFLALHYCHLHLYQCCSVVDWEIEARKKFLRNHHRHPAAYLFSAGWTELQQVEGTSVCRVVVVRRENGSVGVGWGMQDAFLECGLLFVLLRMYTL